MPRYRSLTAPVVICLLAFAGCGSTVRQAAAPTATPSPSPTVTPYPTATPAPTLTPTPTPKPSPQFCDASLAPSGKNGDITISGGKNFDPHTLMGDPSVLASPLLASQPPADKPYVVTYQNSMDYGNMLHRPHVLDGGEFLSFTFCNTSKTTMHTIQGVDLRVELFTPYTDGRVDVWLGTCDVAYPLQPQGCPCGGYGGAFEGFSAAWTGTTAQGTVVSLQQTSTDLSTGGGPDSIVGPEYGPVPFKLAPGHSVTIQITTNVPPTPGTYQFTPGLQVDGQVRFFTNVLNPVLIAPITHQWSGGACNTTYFKSLIPANTKQLFICAAS